MRSFMCGCSRLYMLPDVNVCPFCKKDLTSHSDDFARKHLRKCALAIAPRQYSERKRGRPSYKQVAEVMCSFKKHCRNCGRAHCVGCDEGFCDQWEPQKVERCPFCGRMPLEVEKEGVYAIICDDCGVKMIADNHEALVTRWNRKD